jgi:murein L,D-transpeptidase YcbB/YkuD
MTPILLLWIAVLSFLTPTSPVYAKTAGKTREYSQADPAVKQSIQSSLGRLQRMNAGPDRASITAHMQRFYAALGYRTAWTNRDAVSRLIEVIEDSAKDGLLPSDYHLTEIRKFHENPPESPALRARADILMTDAVFTLLSHMRSGKVYPQSAEPSWNLSTPMPSRDYDRTLMTAVMGSRFPEIIQSLRPSAPEYVRLRKALARYRKISADGGWQSVPTGPMIDRVGAVDPRIPAIRKRLIISGDLGSGAADPEIASPEKDADTAATDSTLAADSLRVPAQPSDRRQVYNQELFAAVEAFQKRHGLSPDGIIGNETIAAMNVPVAERIDQIRINLERYRWFLNNRGSTYIAVNIPSFTIDVVFNNVHRWSSRVIVGKPDLQTPVFRAEMQYLILNPHWVIPPGILVKEAIPAISKDISYLSRKKLVVVDDKGNVINPSSINWSKYIKGGFPYRLVQASGDEGSLGRIKFMMPNRFMVYLHDTPAKELFEKSRRAYSHGCVRVDQPLDLAELVMKDPGRWSTSKFQEVIDTDKTRTVNLPGKIPVFFLYGTAFVDGDQVEFRTDLYNKDAVLLKVLDGPASSRYVEAALQ